MTSRLFFALPCPTDIGQSIHDWRAAQGIDGKHVAPGNFHVTLAYLGSSDDAGRRRLERIGDHLVLPCPFALSVDSTGLWAKGILHLGFAGPPEPLRSLYAQLWAHLELAGYTPDTRPFRPHLTLSRRCTAPPRESPPACRWMADSLILYRSARVDDVLCYTPIRRWTFSAAH